MPLARMLVRRNLICGITALATASALAQSMKPANEAASAAAPPNVAPPPVFDIPSTGIEFETGDTWTQSGRLFRLYGVQSCIRGTTFTNPVGAKRDCGEASIVYFAALIKDARPRCTALAQVGSITYTVCAAHIGAQALDLGTILITQGFAFAAIDSSGRPVNLQYGVAERDARENRRGLWASPDLPRPSVIPRQCEPKAAVMGPIMRNDAATIARLLRGRPEGGGFPLFMPGQGPRQGRGDLRPSLSVSDGRRALVFHCFAGCKPRDIIAALNALAPTPATKPIFECRPLREPSARSRTTTVLAQNLWKAALPVVGTRAETYLRARCLPPTPPPTIRFLPSYRYDATRRFPCLIAAVQAPSREIVAVQLTFLDPSGQRKADVQHPRRAIGPLGDGSCASLPSRRTSALPKGSNPHGPHHCCTTACRYGRRSAPTATRSSPCRRRCAGSRFLADYDAPGLSAALSFFELRPEFDGRHRGAGQSRGRISPACGYSSEPPRIPFSRVSRYYDDRIFLLKAASVAGATTKELDQARSLRTSEPCIDWRRGRSATSARKRSQAWRIAHRTISTSRAHMRFADDHRDLETLLANLARAQVHTASLGDESNAIFAEALAR